MSKVSYGTITLTDTIDTDLLGGHFIYKSNSSGTSTPSGAGVIQTVNDNPASWGYNTWIGSNGIQLRTGETAYATLNANGLTLSKGGIKANISDPNNNKVYISSEDYGDNLTINDHTASNWREVIGSNFGVDATGNVYANSAHIAGAVHMESGTIDYGVIIGRADSVHISLSQEQIGFWRGSENNNINKTAYITNQYMYIPYTVVLNEMRVGTKPNYKEVENYSSGSNPSEQKWYEIINGEYVLTTDTNLYVKTEDLAIDATKTYYILNEGNFEVVDNPVIEDIENYYEITSKIYYTKEEDIPLWSWRKMDSGNLRLMWLGGEV